MAGLTLRSRQAIASGSSHQGLIEEAVASAVALLTPSTTALMAISGAVSAVGTMAQVAMGLQKGVSGFTSTPVPTAPLPDGAFRTEQKYTGAFETGAWTFVIGDRATSSNAWNGRHRYRIMLFRGSDPTGANAVAITTTLLTDATTTNTSNTSTNALKVIATVDSFAVNGEYLFIAVAWEVTTKGTTISGGRPIGLLNNNRVDTAIFVPNMGGGGIPSDAVAGEGGELLAGADLVGGATPGGVSDVGSGKVFGTKTVSGGAIPSPGALGNGTLATSRALGISTPGIFRNPQASAVGSVESPGSSLGNGSALVTYAMGGGAALPQKSILSGLGVSRPEYVMEGGFIFAAGRIIKPPAPKTAKLLSGYYGPPDHQYEFWESNVQGDRLRLLKTVQYGGSIEFSNFSDTAWKITLSMLPDDSFNPLSDKMLVTDTVSAGGISEQFLMGLYMFDKPNMTHHERYSTWDLTGRSLEYLLLQDQPDIYSVAAGADILLTVKNILIGRGIPSSMIDFPPVVKTLRNPLTISVTSNTDDGWWYRICTALLNAGGFYALSTTGEGKFYTRLMYDLKKRDPDIIYGPGGDGMLVSPIGDTWESDRFANKIVVISTDTQDTPPLFARRENHNLESEGSIENLGYTKMKPPITLQTATSQADVDRIADMELQRASSYYRKLALATFPDPRCGPQQVYAIRGIVVNSEGVNLAGTWGVINWSQSLNAPRSEMTHEISRVEAV